MAIVLLSGAILMVRSFLNLRNVKPGFDPVGVQAMTVVLPYSRYGNNQQVERFWHDLSDRIEGLPGVKRTGYTDVLPLDGGAGCTAIGMDAGRTAPARRSACPSST